MTRTTTMRRARVTRSPLRRALVAALAVLGLAGCVAIPDAGPVVEGQVDANEQTNDFVFLAQEPQPGATQEEIILGFLGAAISPADDYAIAREYLGVGAAESWDPDARVIVRSGAQPQISFTGEDETAASAALTAQSELSAGGALLAGGDRILEFELLQVGGEWRITRAPDGIVLSASTFDTLFQPHALHWLTPDGTRTVPEVRWFERTATTIDERIIDAVLAGPSTWLSPAVSTFGSVEARRVGPLRVEGTTMTVTLDLAQLTQLGPGSLEPLAVQLALSLREAGVRELRVQIDGVEGVGASSADAGAIDVGEVDLRPLVLEGSTLRSVGGGAPAAADVGATLSAIGATSYTVGQQGGVAHTGTTAAWVVPDAEPVVISADASVVPTVDDSGWVLLHETTGPQQLLTWRDGERNELTLPADAGRPVAMELSRDGARLAYVTSEGGRSSVWVLAVVRDADGRPVTLGEPYPLPAIDGAATDVTWVSSTQVAVLATDEDQSQIAVLTIGGVSEQLPIPNTPVRAIVGGSDGTGTLRALSADDALLSLRGRVWSPAAGLEPVALIATQQ
ncbi:LpqB family beta-propeller domain-containing protein [Agrococcus sp. Marseille-P2731]|uniref:LpqB family beta-propeller domain-containing protein n=1 Tax=Agrococcus sp. Marseille-P2731 TaxID=1841862 RepID=UPI000931CEFF|nr:LpqB family beta-propeller domain-containing protein [Agrococcus sp. Marseille-P2731]